MSISLQNLVTNSEALASLLGDENTVVVTEDKLAEQAGDQSKSWKKPAKSNDITIGLQGAGFGGQQSEMA